MSQEEEDFELNADEAASIPSIAPGAVLFDSYTWLSDALSTDPVAPDPEQEWQLGIDEAGRGSVCGPQVYGVAFCPKDYDKELREFGFDGPARLSCASCCQLTLATRFEEADGGEAEGPARHDVHGLERPEMGRTAHDPVRGFALDAHEVSERS
jgi:hypothetical protein